MSNPSSLHILAKEGDAKTLAQALKNGDPNIEDGDGMRPLHYAAWYGHGACILALLSAGADIDAYDHDGATALHAAAYNGQLATAVILVENKADATVTDNDNTTPHQVAVEEGHELVAQFLVVVEDDQKAEKVLQRLEKALVEAKERLKGTRAEMSKVLKDSKKKVAQMDKEAKKIAKATLKSKKKGSKKTVIPEAGPVSSFSQLAGVNTATSNVTTTPVPVSKNSMKRETVEKRKMSLQESREGSQASIVSVNGTKYTNIREFLESLDLKEFVRVFEDEGMTLSTLQQAAPGDLKAFGIPTGIRKKIFAALNSNLN
eukprot:m.27084 g.27084  ORF g.27084 m.27084 type:complete len:317 (+) comp5910_c1_seq2:115-1065(+)